MTEIGLCTHPKNTLRGRKYRVQRRLTSLISLEQFISVVFQPEVNNVLRDIIIYRILLSCFSYVYNRVLRSLGKYRQKYLIGLAIRHLSKL